MSRPFVVFSLPRSRSAWLSVLLGSPDTPVGHDIGPTVDSVSEFCTKLQELGGSCETGAAFAWKLIRNRLPEAVFVVVKRDPETVTRSLERFGLMGQGEEMHTRAVLLDEISAQPGTLTIDFDALTSEQACAWIYGHCLRQPMPRAWWAHLDPINIQVDMARQIDLLIRRRPQIDALKAEARELAHG